MKYIAAIIGLFIWVLATILITMTLFGIIIFILEDDYGKNYWFGIANKLLKVFEN